MIAEDVTVRPLDAEQLPAFLDLFDAAWGFDSSPEQRRHIGLDLSAENLLGAYLGGEMVGTAMSFSMELTVPGEVRLPMAGVSHVAVHPLRRRQGAMRALMRYQLDDLRARGVPLAGLDASEAAIYGRFGYGPAALDTSWRLARGAARGLADPGEARRLELVDARTALDLIPAVHERARRTQVGDVRTYPGWWRGLVGDGRRTGTRFAVCRDDDGLATGYAIYRIERERRYSAHGTVVADHVIACTDAAYRMLWAYLADIDLTDWVVALGRPEHEPLLWALADVRELVITEVSDHLWVRIVDIPAALSGRRYAAEGSLVLEVTDSFCPWNEGRWLLEGGPDGALCRPASGAGGAGGAALRLDAAALGSLFLGGPSVARLARAGRVAADAATLRRANQMFRSDQDPWCSTKF